MSKSLDENDREHPEVIGKYKILGVIGRGGMGTVYKAYRADLDRFVAIKVILAGALADPEAVARFLREARLAARLKHPRIVPIYDVGIDGSLHYIVMEFVDGKPSNSASASRTYRSDNRFNSPSTWPAPSNAPTIKTSSTAISNPPTSTSIEDSRSECWISA